ncbi:hypothetical protein yc1106_07772 [Curvularia clavata]|uniref:Uncharacterized protein n=1 Tax=Curvularia clavata TaxID=95742 RepID=A0A9Q9DU28_CURCL|nr:hypothetical protein yc1106_07772 [Curvularia clavata]
MKLSITLLFAAAASIVAQDTVSVTESGACEPHGDHWHCANGVPEPTTPPTPEQLASHSAEEAAENSTPASNAVSTTLNVVSSGTALITPSASSHSHDDDDHDDDHVATASTCEPHGDHWHCPSGVAEPTTPPAESASRSASGSAAAATTASGSQAPQQTANAAAQVVGAGQVVALIGVAAYFL